MLNKRNLQKYREANNPLTNEVRPVHYQSSSSTEKQQRQYKVAQLTDANSVLKYVLGRLQEIYEIKLLKALAETDMPAQEGCQQWIPRHYSIFGGDEVVD
ncbi:hypothetical protein ElyMa_004578900 [Elysia marginata]|uniref:Uncharacterized protein n=1 Tax=Elysia marginata TaxID=1093978 RepID=A0AAV4HVY6_9GAST|nr:hypothetical protein ElyMa_004578900 [Elysia marginata]